MNDLGESWIFFQNLVGTIPLVPIGSGVPVLGTVRTVHMRRRRTARRRLMLEYLYITLCLTVLCLGLGERNCKKV